MNTKDVNNMSEWQQSWWLIKWAAILQIFVGLWEFYYDLFFRMSSNLEYMDMVVSDAITGGWLASVLAIGMVGGFIGLVYYTCVGINWFVQLWNNRHK